MNRAGRPRVPCAERKWPRKGCACVDCRRLATEHGRRRRKTEAYRIFQRKYKARWRVRERLSRIAEHFDVSFKDALAIMKHGVDLRKYSLRKRNGQYGRQNTRDL